MAFVPTRRVAAVLRMPVGIFPMAMPVIRALRVVVMGRELVRFVTLAGTEECQADR